MVVQPIGSTRALVRTYQAAPAFWQHGRLAKQHYEPAPAPVVALVTVTLEHGSEGRLVQLRSGVALHGVTTWFGADLAPRQVALRDARGEGWEGRIEAQRLTAWLTQSAAAAAGAHVETKRLTVGPVQGSTPQPRCSDSRVRNSWYASAARSCCRTFKG